MPKVFITGSSGTGKSTVLSELARRGYIVYDTDSIQGATGLVYRETGEDAEWPADTGAMDWKHTYAWNWKEPKISELISSNETVIIGAIVGNWQDYIDRFDIIIVLSVEETLHLNRLSKRTTHEHGNHPDEIKARVAGQKKKREDFIRHGAIAIENGGDVRETANRIQAIIEKYADSPQSIVGSN